MTVRQMSLLSNKRYRQEQAPSTSIKKDKTKNLYQVIEKIDNFFRHDQAMTGKSKFARQINFNPTNKFANPSQFAFIIASFVKDIATSFYTLHKGSPDLNENIYYIKSIWNFVWGNIEAHPKRIVIIEWLIMSIYRELLIEPNIIKLLNSIYPNLFPTDFIKKSKPILDILIPDYNIFLYHHNITELGQLVKKRKYDLPLGVPEILQENRKKYEKLLKTYTEFEWDEEEQTSFNYVINWVMKSPYKKQIISLIMEIMSDSLKRNPVILKKFLRKFLNNKKIFKSIHRYSIFTNNIQNVLDWVRTKIFKKQTFDTLPKQLQTFYLNLAKSKLPLQKEKRSIQMSQIKFDPHHKKHKPISQEDFQYMEYYNNLGRSSRYLPKKSSKSFTRQLSY